MKIPANTNHKFSENCYIKKGLKLLVDSSKNKIPSIIKMILK